MCQVLITQQDGRLIAHVMSTQRELPFNDGSLVSSFNVSQIFLNL